MKNLFSLLTLSTLLLAGCSSDEPTNNENTEPVQPGVETEEPGAGEEEGNWEVTNKIELSQAEKPVMDGMNEFGYKLMAEYAKESKDGSFSVSPVSVSVYLSMMANATAGDTHDQILAALGSTDMEALNSLNSKLMHYLPCGDNGACLEINNRIWLSNRFTAPEAFKSTVKDIYNADVESVDFYQSTTVPAINKWVSDKTHGLISGILYGDWTKFTDLSQTSANTVYFKGDWAVKFDKKATTNSLFNAPTGKVIVDMMKAVRVTYYAKANGVEMVRLSYKNGINAMELYLPDSKTSVKDIVATITPEIQEDLKVNASAYEVTLALPRIKTMPELININNPLKSMGLTSLDATDYSPMGINKILGFIINHQTYISVDEEGTELAAVTGGMDATSPGPNETPQYPKVKVDFDRPFMYIIRNTKTDAILMAGVVTNPKK